MANTFTNLIYHIIYSTKYRRKSIAPAWLKDFYNYIGGILAQRDGVQLEIGGVDDHIHILARLSPKLAIMDVLRDIKAVSSKWVNDQRLTHERFEWQTGYGAFSVSQSQVGTIRNYIKKQEEHHRSTSYETEFLSLLRRNELEFDLKYVFDEEYLA